MSGLDYRNGLINEYAKRFGITLPPGIAAALTTVVGSDGQETITEGEVGLYANALNELNIAAANDPLTKVLATEQALYTSSGEKAAGYAKQLASIYTSAPQLFGNLTPDQITDYLKPLQSQFDTTRQLVEGQAAARGNTGSSLEATALAQTDKQFKEGVVSQGLMIGQQQQQNQAQVLQQLYSQYLGQQSQALAAQQQTGGQISAQNYDNAQFKAQLPLLLNSWATQQNQLRNSYAKSVSPWGAIASGAGAVIGGVYGGPMGAAAGAQIGGGIASSATGEPQGAQTGATLSNSALLLGSVNNNTSNSSWSNTWPWQRPSNTTASSSSGHNGLNFSNQPGLFLGAPPSNEFSSGELKYA